jgi:dTDP-4-dehydrorhamnose reductase
MPTIMLFGADGQLGLALRDLAAGPAGVRLVPVPRARADLTDPVAVRRAIGSTPADVAINAAAYNAVDAAETDVDTAVAVNATGAGTLAAACAAAGLPLVHLSSDYVFPGTRPGLLDEDAPTGPLNAYGRSKLAGETLVRDRCPRHVIVRTAWLFGPHRRNFVRTMLALADTGAEIAVVDDRIGSPTAAEDLAAALVALCHRIAVGATPWGTYHFAGAGPTTWFGLAETIFAEAARYGRPVPAVRPVPSASRPTPAARPRNAALDCRRIAAVLGIEAPSWRPALARCVRTLCEGGGPRDAAMQPKKEKI